MRYLLYVGGYIDGCVTEDAAGHVYNILLCCGYNEWLKGDMKEQLGQWVQAAMGACFGAPHRTGSPHIQWASRPEYGDYQANGAMALAKTLHKPPREVAEVLAQCLVKRDEIARVEVAGPGFLNITLDNNSLCRGVERMAQDARLGVGVCADPQTIVIDYGSPNVAKVMHVGHLRSTVIGDVLARVLDFVGHKVVRQNHIGDWGTQFGMLIEHVCDEEIDIPNCDIEAFNRLYKQAKQRFDEEAGFAERARQRVVALQAHEAETYHIWQQLVWRSQAYFEDIYTRLGVSLSPEDVRAESAYNADLPQVISDLMALKIAQMDQGAVVVFPENVQSDNPRQAPVIIQKTDAGYLYATTDLAAARYRLDVLAAGRLIYVTDARQRHHFEQLFDIVRRAGWCDEHTLLQHVTFGSVLGEDHKPFKTRSGETIALTQLLDEAVERATSRALIKNPEDNPEHGAQIGQIIGIAALKYADLCSDRVRDYVFGWDKMLAFEGNTAPYLLNAYVRIGALLAKSQMTTAQILRGRLLGHDQAEHNLMVRLLEFPDQVADVAQNLYPHRLCEYLYQLARKYHHFYEHCPVLSTKEPDMRHSRLLLSYVTGAVLKQGLSLLGIETVDEM